MAEYHVGCGLCGIYAGVLGDRNKGEWKEKTEVTDEAINAVRDYMVDTLLGGLDGSKNRSGYQWKLKDGRTVALSITIKDKAADIAKDKTERESNVVEER